MRLKRLLCLFGVLVSLSSCQKSLLPVEPSGIGKKIDTLYSKEHFLWPMKFGNKWEYKRYQFNHSNFDSAWVYKNFDSFGFNLDTVTTKPIIFIDEIVDSLFITLNDTAFSCAVFDTYYPETNSNADFNRVYWCNDDGLYSMGIFGERGGRVFKKGLMIPTEIPVYQNWKGQIAYRQYGLFHANEVFERYCISKNDTITTSLGKFECYVIKTRLWHAEDIFGFFDFYDFYVPGKGLICRVKMSVVPGTNYESLLWDLFYIDILSNYSTN